MPSIPPPPSGGWRDPFDGRPFVRVEPRPQGVYDLTLSSGACLRDLVDVTATLPNVIYLDHRPAVPGGSDVVLRFRSLPDSVPVLGLPDPGLYDAPTAGGAGGVGGWVPADVAPGTMAFTPYQEALHLLLTAGPDGPTGARLRRCLLRCDPRSVVALADMVRPPVCR